MGRVGRRLHAVADRAALEEENFLQAVLAVRGRGEAEDIAGWAGFHHRFRRGRRDIVAFVDDHLSDRREQRTRMLLLGESLVHANGDCGLPGTAICRQRCDFFFCSIQGTFPNAHATALAGACSGRE